MNPAALIATRDATYRDYFLIALPLAREAVARGEYRTANPEAMAGQVAHAAAGDMVRRGFTRMVRMPEAERELAA